MPLEYDPVSSQIRYEGQVIGDYRVENGIAKVSFNITYECSPDEWIVPLSWFDYGLSHLKRYQQRARTSDLEITTEEDGIGEEFNALRLLTEKTIKQSGYIWKFHKNDIDPWPSKLHGHEYDKNLTLDAINGCIYDTATRECCMKLKSRELNRIQKELRNSGDFEALVRDAIDNV